MRFPLLSAAVFTVLQFANTASAQLEPLGVTYDVDAFVRDRSIIVTGSDTAVDDEGREAGDQIYLRRGLHQYTQTFAWGGRTYRWTRSVIVIEVLAGVFEGADGELLVTFDNPFPGGVVLRVPVADVDHIDLSMGRGRDGVYSNDLGDITLSVFLDENVDHFRCETDGAVLVGGGSGRDIIDCTNTGPAVVWSGLGDDIVHGSQFDDQLDGGPGRDEINGSGGDDVIEGGRGDDELYGSLGHDVLMGDDGADDLYGGDGIDILIGSSFNISTWPAPDSNGIIFTQSELEDLLPDFHTDDKAGDVLVGGAGNDFIVWWRFQDWIDFPDPDGFSWWVNHVFGRVWRDEN